MMLEQPKFIKIGNVEHTVHGPVSKSVGNANRHYLYCDFHQQRRCYGVCALLLQATPDVRKEWDGSEESCGTAMRKGRCRAQIMRQVEERTGCSLFYEARMGTPERPYPEDSGISELATYKQRTISKGTTNYDRGWARLDKIERLVEAPKVPPAKKEYALAMDVPTLADAINSKVVELGGK